MVEYRKGKPFGKNIKKKRVGGVFLQGLVRVYKMQSGGNVFLFDFAIPYGSSGESWQRVGYNYDWWEAGKQETQIIGGNGKKHIAGRVFYDPGLDEVLGGKKENLGG